MSCLSRSWWIRNKHKGLEDSATSVYASSSVSFSSHRFYVFYFTSTFISRSIRPDDNSPTQDSSSKPTAQSILLDAIRPRMTWQFAHIPMSWQFAHLYINSLISLVPRSSFYITFKSPSCVRGFLLEASLKSKNNSAHARKTFLSTELCLLPSIIAIQHKHKVR